MTKPIPNSEAKLRAKIVLLEKRLDAAMGDLDAALSKLEHVEAQLRSEREAEQIRARRRSSDAVARYSYKNGGH